jgi:hypothetical protein
LETIRAKSETLMGQAGCISDTALWVSNWLCLEEAATFLIKADDEL